MEDPTALLDTDAALSPLLQVAQEASAIANVPTLRAVILKALSHPDIFCGYDQLKVLAVAANLDDAPLLQTLDLFSYGTYSQYAGTNTATTSESTAHSSTSSSQYYLSLTDAQLLKLRQLTVLSCVQDACCGRGGKEGQEGQQSSSSSSTLSYASIAEALQLTDRRSMEQVVISCIYSRVLNAALCQKTQQVLLTTVPPCSSRDVPLRLPSTTTTTHHQPLLVQDLLDRLRGLEQRLAVSHSDLERAHTDVSHSSEQSAAAWKSVQDRQIKAQAQASSSNSNSTLNYSSTGAAGTAGAGGTVRLAGWPESAPSVGQRRSSASRQSKRSRGGLGGSFTEPFQRF
jgi:hypothetical protein